MSELPDRPLAKIVRAADAASWIDGYAFLDRARVEAAALRASVDDEISAARQAGHAEGLASGEAEAARLVARAQRDVDRYLAGLEGEVADLALAIVRRVLGTFEDGELVARIAAEALGDLREEAGLTLHVSPALVAQVEARLREAGAAVRVVADDGLSQHRCVMTTRATSIDIGLDAQLEAVRVSMAEADGR